MLNSKEDRYNFSYSGLKTAVVYHLQRNPETPKEDLAASFQKRAIEVLYKKTLTACKDFKIKRLVIAGGVAANSELRRVFDASGLEVFIPPISLCTDNAAMIGGLAFHLKDQMGSADFSMDAVDKILSYDKKKAFRK